MMEEFLSGQNSMGPRADFKPELFDTLIQQKGYTVIWEQGMLCSCLKYSGQLNSGQPDFTCTVCKGKGYVYFDPNHTRALVTSISGRKEQEKVGLNDFGTAYLTPLSTDDVGFRDRFTFPDFTMKYSELIQRKPLGQVDELRYPAQRLICVREGSNIYKRSIDFELSKGGKFLEWKTNIGEGKYYSVLYSTPAVYIAINPIHELRGTYITAKGGGLERFVQLPKQFQIKREDFVDADARVPSDPQAGPIF
ncbi:hypothetical protein D1872_50640 [compost metagenome]